MIDIDTMAKQMSDKTKHNEGEWHKALTRSIHDATFGSMTDGEIHQFMEAMYSPEQLNWLVDLFQEAHPRMPEDTPFDFLARTVSRSGYSLGDWLLAMYEIGPKKEKSLESLVQFLSESAGEAAQSKPEISLVEAAQRRIKV